ncbi:MAG: GDYXXLXY domain-containing protein [Hyphomicrobium sp.]
MSTSKRTFLALLALVAGLQTAALAYIVVDRDRLLKSGIEIILPVTPLDPRDIFRGDYVTLGNPLSAIGSIAAKLDPKLPDGIVKGGPVYVTIASENDTWAVRAVSPVYPAEVPSGTVVLKGRVKQIYNAGSEPGYSLSVRYGIETYFVPEGTGMALEAQVRDNAIKAILAVGPGGTAAIKGLIVDGQRHEAPAIF